MYHIYLGLISKYPKNNFLAVCFHQVTWVCHKQQCFFVYSFHFAPFRKLKDTKEVKLKSCVIFATLGIIPRAIYAFRNCNVWAASHQEKSVSCQ